MDILLSLQHGSLFWVTLYSVCIGNRKLFNPENIQLGNHFTRKSTSCSSSSTGTYSGSPSIVYRLVTGNYSSRKIFDPDIFHQEINILLSLQHRSLLWVTLYSVCFGDWKLFIKENFQPGYFPSGNQHLALPPALVLILAKKKVSKI